MRSEILQCPPRSLSFRVPGEGDRIALHLLVIEQEGVAARAGLGVGHGPEAVGAHEGHRGVLVAGGVPPQLQLVVLVAPRLAHRLLQSSAAFDGCTQPFRVLKAS